MNTVTVDRLTETLDTDAWKTVHRVRNQTRLEIPLAPTARAWAQYTRPDSGLKYTDNIFRLNFKITSKRGLLSLLDGHIDDGLSGLKP
jgi:hypothetical protein